MKVLIFGSNGMLGNYMKIFLSNKYEIIPLTRKDYDLSQLDINSLSELLISKNLQENDIVINCAGVIPQSSKNRNLNSRLYFTVNSLFPVILSQICEKYEAKMIQITTDCVFSGKDGNYDENSIHDETTDYGLSKSIGELCKATIIRTSIIGEETHSEELVEWLKDNSGKKINGFINHYWNGITCLQLSKIIEDIITKNNFWNGVRHIFSPKSVSKYELVSMINDIYKLNIKINKFKTEYSFDKTIKSIYDNEYIIPDLFEQIKEMKEFNVLNI
jgi:dTDP-4-dehydrorhamnose reductase